MRDGEFTLKIQGLRITTSLNGEPNSDTTLPTQAAAFAHVAGIMSAVLAKMAEHHEALELLAAGRPRPVSLADIGEH